MKKIIIILSLLLINILTYSQIINIENKRFYNDSNNVVGKVKFKITNLKNIDEIIDFGSSFNLQIKVNKSKYIIIADENYVSVNNIISDNNAYLHLRYNYELDSNYTIEAYAQYQYNKPLKVDMREIVGIGIRKNIIKNELVKSYSALSILYERTINKKDTITDNDIRINTYITCYYQITDKIYFNDVVYYQPNISNFIDFRISNELSINIDISKKLTLEMLLNSIYSTKVGLNIPNTIYKYESKIVYNF